MSKNRSALSKLGVVDVSFFGNETLNPRKARDLMRAIGAGADAVKSVNQARASFTLVEQAAVELEAARLDLAIKRKEALDCKAVRRSFWEVVADVASDTYEAASVKKTA